MQSKVNLIQPTNESRRYLCSSMASVCSALAWAAVLKPLSAHPQVFAEKMGLETGWNCHISLTPNGDVPGSEIPPSSPSHAGSLHDDLHQGEHCASLNAMCFLGASFKPTHRFLCPYQTLDPTEL